MVKLPPLRTPHTFVVAAGGGFVAAAFPGALG